MAHHLIRTPPSTTHLTPLRSPPPATGTALPMLDLDRRTQFAQRLAILVRRIQAQHRVHAKEEQADES